ncbi:50S ribosomal protein L11 [Candidatus Pacearchaeota archaeon]|nr:50S ribosomal protein L11 [Candidatus Pacearchaeota archaeon]
MQIKLLADGGAMAPGPALSQKLGPAGINMGQVIQKINEATKDFKGMKVPVEVDVNTSTKTFSIKVFSPPTSELLKKELGIEKGSGLQKKTKVANASIEQIISVAKIKSPNILARTLKSAVKNVVGTCVSLGILVESKHPNEVQLEIDGGKYDEEIKSESTQTPKEKKAELDKYFAKIKEEQEKILKAEQAAAEAEKAAAEAAAAAAGTPVSAAATPATPVAATKETKEVKKEAKPKEGK